MTLDELLALLPDNTTGEISAQDMRIIVEELFNRDEELDARVGALEASAAGITIRGVWKVNQSPGAAPTATEVTKDQASFASANWLRFTEIDTTGDDLHTALMQAAVIYGQMRGDNTKWVRYNVSGSPTDAGAYIQVPVTFDAGEGTFTNGQNAIFVFEVTPA